MASRVRQQVSGLAAALAVLTFGASAFACRTTTCAVNSPPPECVRDPVSQCFLAGEPLFWKQRCVSFSVSGAGVPALGLDYPGAEALVLRAFSLWPNSTCADGAPSIEVGSLGPLSCEDREFNPTGPNANAVIFSDSDWPHGPATLGLTTVSFHPASGEIFSADMEINLTGGTLAIDDVEYILAHEAGHFFGLDHSENPNALMFRSYSPFARQGAPALTASDQAFLCDAYRPGRAAEAERCNYEPEHGFAPDCGGNVEGSCSVSPASAVRSNPRALVWLALGLGLLGLRARSRRRPA